MEMQRKRFITHRVKYITSVSWFAKSRQLIDLWIYSLYLEDIWLPKEKLLIFVIDLSFQEDSGIWLRFPLFLMPTILLPFNYRTLCPRKMHLQKIEITHSIWGKATVSSTFSTIQPYPLFLDMIENLFSLSIGKSAWVRPDGCWPQAIENEEDAQLFSLLLVVTSFGETASRSWHLEDLLSPWTVDAFTGCVLRGSRLPKCHAVNALC